MDMSSQSNQEKFRLSCSLYELIELWSLKNSVVELSYIDGNNQSQKCTGIVTNIYSRNGLEQIVIDDDLIVTTNNILKINDVFFKE